MNTMSETLQREFGITQVIWIAIFAALLVYAAIGYFVYGGNFVEPGSVPVQLIRNILAGVGGLLLIGSFFIRRKMLAGGSTGQPLAEEAVAKKYRMATMISAGICETVGLFGLVLVFLGDSLSTCCLFIVVAAVAMILHRPKKEELQQLAGK